MPDCATLRPESSSPLPEQAYGHTQIDRAHHSDVMVLLVCVDLCSQGHDTHGMQDRDCMQHHGRARELPRFAPLAHSRPCSDAYADVA